jgi:hypothetical protein
MYNHIPESAFRIKPEMDEADVVVPLSPVVTDKIKQQNSLLLMVYIKEEFEKYRFNSVPVINYLLKDENTSIRLPEGEYSLITRSSTGVIIEQSNIITKK